MAARIRPKTRNYRGIEGVGRLPLPALLSPRLGWSSSWSRRGRVIDHPCRGDVPVAWHASRRNWGQLGKDSPLAGYLPLGQPGWIGISKNMSCLRRECSYTSLVSHWDEAIKRHVQISYEYHWQAYSMFGQWQSHSPIPPAISDGPCSAKTPQELCLIILYCSKD